MEYRSLGRTDLKVSAICLGTMTWGQQNTEAEAHIQMDYALDQGINFFDTAEMYPVPPKADTQGRTEQYIGTWFQARKNRDKVILATKVTGRSQMSWVRGGENPRLDYRQISMALEASLQRLQTDYIDLYQLHWPERQTNYFGQLGYNHVEKDDALPIEETLEALDKLVKTGKIRHIGLSNETPWGVMRFLALSEKHGWPRVVSVQNPYNLLNRSYEVGLAEVSIREDCGLLAYSPLAMGMLSGKYLDGARPKGARMTEFSRFTRYLTDKANDATQEYVQCAQNFDLDPSQMALAFVTSRRFVTSNIIGATSMEQLKLDIDSAKVTLTPEVLKELETIHERHLYPCP